MGTINPRVDSAVAVGRTDVDATTMYSERAVMVLMVVGGAYVATSLMANVMSVRILSLGGWAVDAGTLTYPLTFTLRDVVHKAGGTAVARTTVVATPGSTRCWHWGCGRQPSCPAIRRPPERPRASLPTCSTRCCASSRRRSSPS